MTYLLFEGEDYYPSGGWHDFKGHFETIEQAKTWLEENYSCPCDQWAHIVYQGKIILNAYSPELLEHTNWIWESEL